MAGRSIRTKVVDGFEQLEYEVSHRLTVEGSHDSSITLRSLTDRTIEISGNPVKFLQGHNVFGTNDLKYLIATLFDALCKIEELKLTPTDIEYDAIQDGEYRLSRVDVNEHYSFPTEQQAKAWLRAAGRSANMRYRGAGLFKEGTLYFVPSSRRYVPKIYHKGDEITSNAKGHKLPDALLQIPQLLDYAKKSLRFEIKILSTQLNEWHLHSGCNWTPEVATLLIKNQFLDKLQLSDNMTLSDDVLTSLPRNLVAPYTLWTAGHDLRQFYSKAQFYKHRKALLAYTIDISVLQEKEVQSNNIVPMISCLNAQPMGIPQWAYALGLVA